jgi:hypothetical protein
MRPALLLLLLLVLALPASALSPADAPALRAVLDYGEANYDATTGLVKDPSGTPNVVESSLGYVVAAFAQQQDLERAKSILGKALDLQQTAGPRAGAQAGAKAGPQAGQFPWYGIAGCAPSAESLLYITPLLAHLYSEHGDQLGDLKPRLQASLELIQTAVPRVKVGIEDDTRYLLRSAARATVGAALGTDGPAIAATEVAKWLRFVSAQGLPGGHSPTADATRLIALKWVLQYAPEAQQPAVQQALTLVAVDLGLRVDPAAQYLAGAIAQAYQIDYTSASGFARYVLFTDFGQPLSERLDPYIVAALLPAWRAPAAVKALAQPGASGLLRTRGPAPIQATSTYIGSGFSLGTMSGEVAGSTLPIFLTFNRTERPDAYFYCAPAPCAVQSVQADGLSMSSFNFDGLATPNRLQGLVRGVMGRAEDIEEVYSYGVKWNDRPTSLGEQESLAFTTRGCYVGVTLMRVGAASNATDSYAKPATLSWSGEGRTGDLVLDVYARQANYPLPRPENNMRAGVIIEVAPQTAYLTLEDFAKHLTQGQLKQAIRATRQRVPAEEKPRDPNVLIPEPQSKIDMVYRNTLEQTSTYTINGRTLSLVEDLIGNITLSRQINETPIDEKYLWQSENFTFEPSTKLSEALTPFVSQPAP